MTYEIDDQGRVTSSLRNTFVQDKDGDWTYLKDKGQVATGWQTIDGIQLYFDGTGKQIKGERILIDGKYYYSIRTVANSSVMHSIPLVHIFTTLAMMELKFLAGIH